MIYFFREHVALLLVVLPLILAFKIDIGFSLEVFDVFKLKSFKWLLHYFFISVDVAVWSRRYVVHGLLSLHSLAKDV